MTESNVSANDMQVGGTHYAAGLQHWDLVEQHGLGYIEGCATKYVTRARKKNGLQDVKKAEHFVVKLLELHENSNRVPRGVVPTHTLELFTEQNELTPLESGIICLLCSWKEASHLRAVLKDLQDLKLQFPPEQ